MKQTRDSNVKKGERAAKAKVKAAGQKGRGVVSDEAELPMDTPTKLFAFMAGAWIGLSIIKFGNPIIFEQMISAPRGTAELLFTSWPPSWGYLILGIVLVAAIPVVKPFWRKDCWPIACLGAWLFWQFVSGAQSVDAQLSNPTLLHFTSCVVAFGLGWWVLGPRSRLAASGWFWGIVLLAFFYVLFTGFEQHNGGLEATRRSFYEQPNWQMYPKDYLLKIQSPRIFGTLVYPNALAQLILLFIPVGLWQCWQLTGRCPRVARGVVTGLLAYVAFACLYWSGSKGGWLITLIVLAVIFMHFEIPWKVKTAVIAAGLVLGLTVFFLRFAGYFERGATSTTARFTYWKAAVRNVTSHPVLGSGPGTFSVPYKQLKAPEAEMAKLTHNDYLEQATDSGIVGFMAFSAFILGSLSLLYRKSVQKGWFSFLLWAGLFGWCLQAFIEFGLYIPASAWPVFLFFGVLWGGNKSVELSVS